jgi:hypothetical protein
MERQLWRELPEIQSKVQSEKVNNPEAAPSIADLLFAYYLEAALARNSPFEP